MPIRVFLSYARKDDPNDYDDPDKSFMRRLYNALIAAGFEVWWDKVNMPSRALSFSQEISDALDSMDRVVLVLGAVGLKSKYVKAEWQYALDICLPVTPILLNVGFDKVPKKLKNQHTVDFRDTTKFDERSDDLIRILNENPHPLGRLYNLNRLPPKYVPRQKEMKKVKSYLLEQATKPTVITSSKQAMAVYGMGGIGKSTLGNALCRDCEIRYTFRDGIIWLEVGKPDKANISERIRLTQARLGEMLNDNPAEYTDIEKGKQRLSTLTYGKRLLVVLDDVWDEAVVKAFDTLTERCRLLVTTRDQMLAVRTGGHNYDLGRLDEAEALALFKAYLGSNIKAIETPLKAIIQLVEGHTLALDLAGAQLANRPDYAPRLLARMQEQFRQEQSNKGVFSDLQLAEEDKNRNLEISLGISYEDLDSTMQQRFRALGVLAPNATFSLDLARAIWVTTLNETEDTLALLCQNSLLTHEKDGRYRQHSLLSAYTRALASREGEFTLEICYFEWVINFTEQFRHLPPETWDEKLRIDIPHMLYVGDYLFSIHKEIANEHILEIIIAYFAFNYLGYLQYRYDIIRIEWLAMGLAIAIRQNTQLVQAIFLNRIGKAYHTLLGNLPKALEYCQTSLSLSRIIGEKQMEIMNLNEIGAIYQDLGEMNKAFDYLHQALSLCRAIGNPIREQEILNNLGRFHHAVGQRERALEYFHQTSQSPHMVDNLASQGLTLNQLGLVYHSLGDMDKALAHFQQSLTLSRNVGNKVWEATNLGNLAAFYQSIGEVDQALDYYNQALSLENGFPNNVQKIEILNNLGEYYRLLGNIDKALEFLEQTLSLSQTSDNRKGEAYALNNLGLVYYALGEMNKALEYFKQALPLHDLVGNPAGEAYALNNLGLVYHELGEMDKALEYFQQALSLHRLVGNRAGEAQTLGNLGTVYVYLGNSEQSLEYFHQGLVLSRATRDRNQEMTTCYNIGVIYLVEQEDLDKAIEYIEKAFLLSQKIKSPSMNLFAKDLEELKQFRAVGEQLPASQRRIPDQELEILVSNTVSVKTQIPEKLLEWQESLKELKKGFQEYKIRYIAEIDFLQALLAILDDQPLTIPEDNPYYPYVVQVQQAIRDYHTGET